jgi:DNA-directed RNA polymerase, mitochondrial
MGASDDPVIASYDVCLTDSKIPRYVLQYVDRPANRPYDEFHEQRPTVFRFKPQTGLIEVDVPIKTSVNYDVQKGRMHGEALRRSRTTRDGGAYGLAGGFSIGGPTAPAATGARMKTEPEDVEMIDISLDTKERKAQAISLLNVQTLGGRIKEPCDGDPIYMLGTFRESR